MILFHIIQQINYSQVQEMHQIENPEQQKKSIGLYRTLKKSQISLSPSKLSIYEILACKLIFYTTPSQAAKSTCLKILGAGIHSIPKDSNSNLKALSFIMLATMFHPKNKHEGQFTIRHTIEQLSNLQKQNLTITNYPFSNKFSPNDYFLMIGSMLEKIAELTEEDLDIFEIIDVYAVYLQLMAFFLRSVLIRIKYESAEDFLVQLPTPDIFSLLTQYFDLSCYIKNGSLFMFPDFHLFITAEEGNQFVFGRYYQSVEDLKQSQRNIRQSTLSHINRESEKYDSMKISKVDLAQNDQTQDGVRDSNIFNSKAPTPQFGQISLNGFDGIIEKDADEQTPTPSSNAFEKGSRYFHPEGNQKYYFQSFHAYHMMETNEENSKDKNQFQDQIVGESDKNNPMADVSSPISENVVHYIGSIQRDLYFVKESADTQIGLMKNDSERMPQKRHSHKTDSKNQNRHHFCLEDKLAITKIKSEGSDNDYSFRKKNSEVKLSSAVYNLNLGSHNKITKSQEKNSNKQFKVQFIDYNNVNSQSTTNFPKQQNKNNFSHCKRKSGARPFLHPHQISLNTHSPTHSVAQSTNNRIISNKIKEMAIADLSYKRQQRSLSRSGYSANNGCSSSKVDDTIRRQKMRNTHIPAFLKKRKMLNHSPKSTSSRNTPIKPPSKCNPNMVSTYYTSSKLNKKIKPQSEVPCTRSPGKSTQKQQFNQHPIKKPGKVGQVQYKYEYQQSGFGKVRLPYSYLGTHNFPMTPK